MRHKAAQSQTEAEHEGRQAADRRTLTGVGPRQFAVLFYEAAQDGRDSSKKLVKGSQKVGSSRKAERQYSIKIK
jgi:hypothetical protein